MMLVPPGRRSDSRIFGIELSPQTQEQLVADLLGPSPASGIASLVATINVDHVVTLRKDPRFREAYANAWRVTVDGAPVFLYARVTGVPLPHRVTGADLFAELVQRWEPPKHRLFMLVCEDEVAIRLRRLMALRGYDPRTLAIEVPPFGFEKDEEYSLALAARIRAIDPTHVILGVGAPKSEIWAHDHRRQLGNAFVLCVGAAPEFVTGLKTRSPVFMRRIGMEWAWRFATEPRRLFHRYFVRSFGFILAMFEDRSNDRRLHSKHD